MMALPGREYRLRRHRWTAEQDRLLDRWAGRARPVILAQVVSAAGPPRSVSAVEMRAHRRGISLARPVARRPDTTDQPPAGWAWTREQDRALRDLAGTLPLPALSAVLNVRFHTDRNEKSLQMRGHRLGISLAAGGLGLTNLVRIFRVHNTKIVAWVEAGLLVAAVRGNGHRGSLWWFREADVLAFVDSHPDVVDWRRVRPGRFQDAARAASIRMRYLTPAEAAAVAGVCVKTVYKYHRQGRIAGTSRAGSVLAGRLRIPLAAVDSIAEVAGG